MLCMQNNMIIIIVIMYQYDDDDDSYLYMIGNKQTEQENQIHSE